MNAFERPQSWARQVVHRFVILMLIVGGRVYAAVPLLEFVALTPTSLSLPEDGEASVQYRLTNQSPTSRTFTMVPITGIDVAGGIGACVLPFALAPQQSCVLNLHLIGSQMGNGVTGGPTICVALPSGDPDPLQCWQPSAADQLNIVIIPTPRALITATPASLSFAAGTLASVTLSNDPDSPVPAQDLAVDVPPNTGIDVDLGTCAAPLAPGASCELLLGAAEPQPTTTLVIAGSNTIPTSIDVTVTDVLFADGFDLH